MPAPLPLDPPDGDDWLVLTDDPLEGTRALEWVGGERWGGVVAFFGMVRDHADERTGVVAVDYEAYEDQVLPRLVDLASAVRTRLPDVGRIVLWHRTGRVALGEASVAVVVSAPHRREAFEACRWLIDTLKATLPIWKLEHWGGGSDWSPSAHLIRPVGPQS